jgi:hypothetical protein
MVVVVGSIRSLGLFELSAEQILHQGLSGIITLINLIFNLLVFFEENRLQTRYLRFRKLLHRNEGKQHCRVHLHTSLVDTDDKTPPPATRRLDGASLVLGLPSCLCKVASQAQSRTEYCSSTDLQSDELLMELPK